MKEVHPGAVETPAHLKPVATMINASVVDFADQIEQKARYSRGEAEQAPLQATLLRLPHYDGVQTTAASLKAAIEPFVQKKTDSNARVKDFVDDLEYVDLLEHGGIDNVNARLRELLNTIKTGEGPEEQNAAANALNRLLFRAIYVFPHLATGIEVTLAPKTVGTLADISDTFGSGELHTRRRTYDLFRKDYREIYQEEFSSHIITALPYSFTTGIHGSGERHATGVSKDTVLFERIQQREDFELSTLALAVDVEAPGIKPRLTHFMLDEIEDIQFVYGREFTPQILAQNWRKELRPRANEIAHYLDFRDFARFSSAKTDGPLSKLTREEWQESRSRLWIPRSRNLWAPNRRPLWKDNLATGYIASVGETTNDVTLYDVSGYSIVSGNSQEAGAVLFSRIGRRGDRGIPTYTGIDAIAKLAEIPVEERRF